MIPRRTMPSQLMTQGYSRHRPSMYQPGERDPFTADDPTTGLTPIGRGRFLTPTNEIVEFKHGALVNIYTQRVYQDFDGEYVQEQGGAIVRSPMAHNRVQDDIVDFIKSNPPGEYTYHSPWEEATDISVDVSRGTRVGIGVNDRRQIDKRLNQWWGDWIAEGAGLDPDADFADQHRAVNTFLGQDVWGHPDDVVTSNWLAQPGGLILELAAAGGDIRGMLNRALQMSLDDPDKFIRLQVQLLEHGFLEETPTWGVWSMNEALALGSIIDAKYRWGNDKSLTDILAEGRTTYGMADGLDEAGLEALRGVDAAAADELEMLRDIVENFEAQLTLSSSDYLRETMQDAAVNQLGRRLSDQEVDALVSDVHSRQREDFYQNDPQMHAYRDAVRKYEDALTNDEERRAGAISGSNASQVDLFLRAVANMESLGSGGPNALNPDSGASGTFQFMPGTWLDVTREAGLDASDKSPENQLAAARYHAAKLYSKHQDWRDVFISWYAGEGALGYDQPAMLADQWGGEPNNSQRYPSIMAYADKGMQIMQSLSQEVDGDGVEMPYDGDTQWAAKIAATVGSAVAAGKITPDDPSTWRIDPGEIGSVSDFNPGGPTVHESERFDPTAYLQSAVADGAGPEADAWSYAMNAATFFDNLGRR